MTKIIAKQLGYILHRVEQLCFYENNNLLIHEIILMHQGAYVLFYQLKSWSCIVLISPSSKENTYRIRYLY